MKIKTAISALAMSVILVVTGCSGDSGVAFSRGKYDAETKKYISETFGISVTLDDNWEVYDDSKLASLSVITGSSDEDFVNALDSKGYVFDFFAQSYDKNNNSINISVDNLKNSGDMLLSEEKIAQNSLEQLKTQFEALGSKVEKAEKTTTNFAGKEMHSNEYKIVINGVTVYEIHVFIKKGNYLCSVTLDSFSEDDVKNLAGMFNAL